MRVRYTPAAGAATLVALTLAVFLTLAGSASASGFLFKETFGSAAEPSFLKPTALAVDPASGDLLVVDVEAKTISRFNLDGTPASFSALGTNVIDGKTGADDTPEHGLDFAVGNPRQVQVAVDNSGGETDGNIYVSQIAKSLIDIFEEDGTYLGQLTEFKEGLLAEGAAKKFAATPGAAVDSTGAVYVSDFINGGLIHKYVPTGSFPENTDSTANFPHPSFGRLAAGAGPTAGFIFASEFGGNVTKLDSSTGEEKYVVDPGESITITVDPASGHLFSTSESVVKEFDASGATEAKLLGSFSPGSGIRGIAVNGTSGDVYVAREGKPKIEVWERVILPDAVTEAASSVGASSATLNGKVNPNGVALSECFFEWGETTAYGNLAPCADPDAAEVGEGSAPVAVHADVAGLKAGRTYHFRLIAVNSDGSAKGADKALQALGPTIKGESVSQVSTTAATISGLINPNGEATSFAVEYVTEAQFLKNEYAEAESVPAPPEEIGSGSTLVEVSQELNGLTPDTAYRFRLVATNQTATAEGDGGQFSTFAEPPLALPDGRAYEMVSPSQKAGEVIPPEPLGSLNQSCTECLPGENVATLPMQAAPDGESVLYMGQPFTGGLAAGPNEYVSRRSSSGWGTQSLSSPITTGQYRAFSSDFSLGVLSQDDPALSPEAPTREGEAFPNLYLRGEDGSFEPLVSEEPPQREPFAFSITYSGANAGAPGTAEFSHLIFEANDALTGEVPGVAPQAPEVGAGACPSSECNLYEWDEGQLRLVNVLPGNASAAHDAVIGSGRLLASGNGTYEAPNVDHAISDDGSRIFWSDTGTGQVFVRIDGAETLEIPGPGLCKESVPLADRACFLTASADGSLVLLSDGKVYELNEEAEAYEESADLSEGQGGFEGILGAAEDLSDVYFVDTAVLTGAEENANGEHAEAGKLNLYAWSEGDTTFLGVLLEKDNGLPLQGRYGAWKASRPDRTAQITPDGAYLAFMSRAPLTGYDNTFAGGGECSQNTSAACLEVFVYAAGPETLSCASCNPSGQRPIGSSNLSLLRPGSPGSLYSPFPQPGNLSDEGEGRVFFESQDTLSPRDLNGDVQDVYEWEPNGVGSCKRPAGCVFLISSGQAANDSMFLDSTPSGDDVFFITREKLLLRDKDDQLDLYDARVGGGIAEDTTPPCLGEACRGPFSTAPEQPGAASSTFAGPGNEKPKKQKKKKKKRRKHKSKRAAKHNRGGQK